jgi:hypothetical protein
MEGVSEGSVGSGGSKENGSSGSVDAEGCGSAFSSPRPVVPFPIQLRGERHTALSCERLTFGCTKEVAEDVAAKSGRA